MTRAENALTTIIAILATACFWLVGGYIMADALDRDAAYQRAKIERVTSQIDPEVLNEMIRK